MMSGKREDPARDALLSAYVDGELDPEAAAEVERRLEDDPEARSLVADLRRLKTLAGTMRIRDPRPEEWERFWASHYNRVERSLGWLLLAVGGLLVAAWAGYSVVAAIWSSPDLPTIVRWGALAGVAGLLVLLVSVVRERLHRRRTTRYRDVIR